MNVTILLNDGGYQELSGLRFPCAVEVVRVHPDEKVCIVDKSEFIRHGVKGELRETYTFKTQIIKNFDWTPKK